MLSRILYVLIILGVILFGGFALNFLVEKPGALRLELGGRIYELTLFEATIGIVLGILLILVAIKVVLFCFALIRFIAGDAGAFGSIFAKRRERRGMDALSRAMVALSAGDAKAASKAAKLAEQRLMPQDLTRLVIAQAAVLDGDQSRAETYFKALMSEPSTAFVGAQGLLGQALEKGETDRALTLANHARELQPNDEATLETLYTLQSRKFDWDAARKTVTDQRRAGHIEKLEADRREGGLVLAQAEDALEAGDEEQARQLAVQAAKLDPSNVNAVSKAVSLLVPHGAKRAATKLVTDGWRIQPHPVLAAAFASIEPDESPAERRRRFNKLFELQPNHDETRFLRAELALVAEDWSGARNSIEDLRETEPSARSCAILAAIARGEGESEDVVRAWLARAIGAPRNAATDSEISHAAMLPLLIGADTMRATTDVTMPPEPAAPAEAEDAETAVAADEDTAGTDRKETA